MVPVKHALITQGLKEEGKCVLLIYVSPTKLFLKMVDVEPAPIIQTGDVY